MVGKGGGSCKGNREGDEGLEKVGGRGEFFSFFIAVHVQYYLRIFKIAYYPNPYTWCARKALLNLKNSSTNYLTISNIKQHTSIINN